MNIRKQWNVTPASSALDEAIWEKINQKTKPVGALGKLEALAFQIARVQHTLTPSLNAPTVAVFAGDHGIARAGLVNPFPQEVTFQMVMNFLGGKAAINVLAQSAGMDVKVINAGVNFDFDENLPLIQMSMGKGTADYRTAPAMPLEVCHQAIEKGAAVVANIAEAGTNVIGFGEMGIGNTSSAALLMSALCDLPIASCVGRGTGADDQFLKQKIHVLEEVVAYHQLTSNTAVDEILATYGGFEIAQIVGGMLEAAQRKMIILVDGFISTSAMLVASHLEPNIIDYAVFAHQSEEQGHVRMLSALKAKPVLAIGMRLGEGSGCAAVYPMLNMAVSFFNEMSSFQSAGVSERTDS